ncbi:MAG: hypothetical protein ACKPFF_35250, partial [Planktothrix sp.]
SNYRLSEEEVLEFSKELTKNNSLLLEILSKPSGHIEPDDDDEDLVIDLTETDVPNHKPSPKVIIPDCTNGDDIDIINDLTGTDDPNHKKEKNIAFLFNGSKYEVSSWKELLITVCNL